MSSPLPPPPDLIAALRADLLAAGYTVAGIDELLGPAAGALRREQLAAAGWWLDTSGIDDDPLTTLVRLFLLGQWMEPERVAAAVPATGLPGLLRLDLVADEPRPAGRPTAGAAPESGTLRALVDLRPYTEDGGPSWWVVSDHGEQVVGGPLPTGHVLGIGQASLTLAGATIRRPVGAALDLGTGCGVQALHLTRHADRVVATDVSVRALRLARMGLELGGAQVELREGSLLDPVAGERFDLIVANPPFVITPRVEGVPEYTYRDGGRTGDELTAGLVAEVGRYLNPGGVAQFLGNWEVAAGQSWTDKLSTWLDAATDGDGNPLDAWIVQRELVDPADYAALWARDGGATGRRQDELTRAWLDDFAAREVESIGLGLITLRKPGPGTAPLRRLEHRPENVSALGAHLDACLRGHDKLAASVGVRAGGLAGLPGPNQSDGFGAGGPAGLPGPDQSDGFGAGGPAGLPGPDQPGSGLRDARLSVAADVVEQRDHRPGEPEPERILLRQTAGFGRQVVLDTAMAAFVGACDGELTFGQIAQAISQLLELPLDGVTQEMELTARELVLAGMLSVTVDPLERRGGSAYPPHQAHHAAGATVLAAGQSVHGGQVRKPR